MRILAALLASVALHCAAAPFVVRLGIERVVLDLPPGLSDTTELASPRLQELAETVTSASNRILLFALTDADLRRFTTGDQIDARRYAIAVTPRAMETERVSARAFNAFVAESLRELGKATVEGDLLKFLDKQPHGKGTLIAEMRKDASVVSVLQGTRLPEQRGGLFTLSKPAQYLFSTTSILLLQGKVLRLDVYTGLDTMADVEWLRHITERWVSDLVRLNRAGTPPAR